MAKRKEQYLKQKIATVGDNSTKFTRRMEALAKKMIAKFTSDDLKFEECRPITDKQWIQLREAMRDMIIRQFGISPSNLGQQTSNTEESIFEALGLEYKTPEQGE